MAVDHDPIGASPGSAVRWLEEHGDALYAYARSRVRDANVAEDLVQEALLAGLASAGGFLGQAAERTWLIGILKHKLVDHLGLADSFDRRGHWKVRPSEWSANPHDLAESAEFRDVLAQCLSQLPSRMAQMFWLRESEDMETTELCERLNVSAANVWAILHRARTGLRKCLSIHWFKGDDTR